MRKVIFLTLLFAYSLMLSGQTSNVEFGKNRVQYHKKFEEWQQYESENFIAYWYGEARPVAQLAVMLAEEQYPSVVNLLEHRINDKIELIVYQDLSDIKQSNVGTEEVFMNQRGQTKVVEKRVFLYYPGESPEFQKQIRRGIATVLVEDMMFGSNIQEIVQNALLMNLPPWFKSGLESFAGSTQDEYADASLSTLLREKPELTFQELERMDAELAGRMFWQFMVMQYGRNAVSNILYMTRIQRNVDETLGYLYSMYSKEMTEKALNFFKQRISLSKVPDVPQKIQLSGRKWGKITRIDLHEGSGRLALVRNDIGKASVWMQTGRSLKDWKRIFVTGQRNQFQETDPNYPLIQFSPDGRSLYIFYEKKDLIYYRKIDVLNGEATVTRLSPEYQRLYSVDFIQDDQMVFSAQVRGTLDLFRYFIKTNQSERFTYDYFDDLDASYLHSSQRTGILFRSNRHRVQGDFLKLDSILPSNQFDLFFLDLGKEKGKITRLTRTENVDEARPVSAGNDRYHYSSNRGGYHELYTGQLFDSLVRYQQVYVLQDGSMWVDPSDSLVATLDTAKLDSVIRKQIVGIATISGRQQTLDRNLLQFQVQSAPSRVFEILQPQDKPGFFLADLDDTAWRTDQFEHQLFVEEPSPGPGDLSPSHVPPAVGADSWDVGPPEVQDMNAWFQSEFDADLSRLKAELSQEQSGPDEAFSIRDGKEGSRSRHQFRQSLIIPYREKFKITELGLKLDNSQLFGGLQTFRDQGSVDFGNAPIGILFKPEIQDLLENYMLELGFRLPTTFNGEEFFVTLNDRKHRLDKRYSVYYKHTTDPLDNSFFVIPRYERRDVMLAQTQFRYPLDMFQSFRSTVMLRNDKTIYLATDDAQLNPGSGTSPLRKENETEQRFGISLEYVYDNTLDVSYNIRNGTRLKIFQEWIKRFEIAFTDKAYFQFGKGVMGILGFDARFYKPVLRKSVIATRVAAATSFGSERMLFILGGVDNWLFANRESETPLPAGQDFAYQTLATNMRGFKQNIRNGASYFIWNTEVRMPVLHYLFPLSRSAFMRNFQMVGFFDAGTAWHGSSPFDKNNPINIKYISNPVVSVKVNYYRDPIVMGYGLGARALLFGYSLRLDYGWGLETKIVQPPQWHFSVGLDF